MNSAQQMSVLAELERKGFLTSDVAVIQIMPCMAKCIICWWVMTMAIFPSKYT
jgi:hypothetical protein